ncbi:MAG: radical SAM protein [Muribaculaceae bacterium]|nr:radical SAM protein [Muribaculaceae bacterium]
MYPINEIFYSLQGEGHNTGIASVFIRFSGCNLRCAFCDTEHQSHVMMSLPQIVDEVMKFPDAQLIILTGGEPSLYVDVPLLKALHMTGKKIAIETNGTRPLQPGIDWVTLSPKFGFPGGDIVPCVMDRCDELKVVYLGQDLSQYDNITAEHRFLQPCFVPDEEQRQINIQRCVDAVLQNPRWRLSLQTHRFLGIR